jgi:macrolide-specific efflux system membrane fusion protein
MIHAKAQKRKEDKDKMILFHPTTLKSFLKHWFENRALFLSFAPWRLCAKLPIATRALIVAALVLNSWNAAGAAESASGESAIEVQSVVLRLLAEAEVPAQESGVLVAVPVHEGQRVERGELLAQIDDQMPRMAERAAELAYEVANAKATNDVQVEFARKAAEVAEAELRRSTESIERFAKSVSQSQLDVERLTVDKTRLEIKQAEQDKQIATLEAKAQQNELATAKVDVARRQINAPFDGIVVQIFVRRGEWVEPGEKALRIVDPSRLKAEGFLAADDAAAELVGAPVQLTIEPAGGGRQANETFTGRLAFVSPEIDPITGQVRVWAEIDNRDGRLRPGQAVRMTIGKGQEVVSR